MCAAVMCAGQGTSNETPRALASAREQASKPPSLRLSWWTESRYHGRISAATARAKQRSRGRRSGRRLSSPAESRKQVYARRQWLRSSRRATATDPRSCWSMGARVRMPHGGLWRLAQATSWPQHRASPNSWSGSCTLPAERLHQPKASCVTSPSLPQVARSGTPVAWNAVGGVVRRYRDARLDQEELQRSS